MNVHVYKPVLKNKSATMFFSKNPFLESRGNLTNPDDTIHTYPAGYSSV